MGGGEVLSLYLGSSGTEIRRTQEGCNGVLTNNPLQKVGTMFGVVSTQESRGRFAFPTAKDLGCRAFHTEATEIITASTSIFRIFAVALASNSCKSSNAIAMACQVSYDEKWN